MRSEKKSGNGHDRKDKTPGADTGRGWIPLEAGTVASLNTAIWLRNRRPTVSRDFAVRVVSA